MSLIISTIHAVHVHFPIGRYPQNQKRPKGFNAYNPVLSAGTPQAPTPWPSKPCSLNPQPKKP